MQTKTMALEYQEDETDRIIEIGDLFLHFKGNIYEVINMATDCDTNSVIVVYKPITGNVNGCVFYREYDEFISEVDHNKYPNEKQKYRFTKIHFETHFKPEYDK